MNVQFGRPYLTYRNINFIFSSKSLHNENFKIYFAIQSSF